MCVMLGLTWFRSCICLLLKKEYHVGKKSSPTDTRLSATSVTAACWTWTCHAVRQNLPLNSIFFHRTHFVVCWMLHCLNGYGCWVAKNSSRCLIYLYYFNKLPKSTDRRIEGVGLFSILFWFFFHFYIFLFNMYAWLVSQISLL